MLKLKPAMVELPEDNDPEAIRADVREAVQGVEMIRRAGPTVRMLARDGGLDYRCTSAPVYL